MLAPFTVYLALLFAVYHLLRHLVYKWTISKFTVLRQVPALGTPREGGRLPGTAVICGGSIAGLLAARICSDHFETIVIIDPDNAELTNLARKALPDQPGGAVDFEVGRYARARVMQTRIIHVSQALNLMALDRLFPSFREWLKTIKASVGSVAWIGECKDGVHIPHPTSWFKDGKLPEVFSTSRGAYETLLRRLILSIPNVLFVDGTIMEVKQSDEILGKLEQVIYRTNTGALATQEATLVVDCTGPGHAGTTWLKRAGFSVPHKESYNPHLRYYTAEYNIDPMVMAKILPGGFDRSKPYIMLNGNKLDRDGKVLAITQIEDDRIHIMSGGWAFKDETETIADLRKWLGTFRLKQPHPQWLWDLLDYLEGEPEKTRLIAVRSAGALFYNKYHEMSAGAIPSNFVAIGDAGMRLNPVFGQGLTKVMIGTIVLDSQLRQVSQALGSTFSSKFFKTQHDKLAAAWDVTKYVDYTLDTTEPSQGESHASGGFPRWLFRAVEDLEIQGEPEAVGRKLELVHWMAPPQTLLAPTLLLKIAKDILTRWLSQDTSYAQPRVPEDQLRHSLSK